MSCLKLQRWAGRVGDGRGALEATAPRQLMTNFVCCAVGGAVLVCDGVRRSDVQGQDERHNRERLSGGSWLVGCWVERPEEAGRKDGRGGTAGRQSNSASSEHKFTQAAYMCLGCVSAHVKASSSVTRLLQSASFTLRSPELRPPRSRIKSRQLSESGTPSLKLPRHAAHAAC